MFYLFSNSEGNYYDWEGEAKGASRGLRGNLYVFSVATAEHASANGCSVCFALVAV